MNNPYLQPRQPQSTQSPEPIHQPVPWHDMTPRTTRSRGPFRWWLITVPLATAFMLYLITGASTSFEFIDISKALEITHVDRWTSLVVLAIGLIGLVLVLRVLLHRKDDA